jgi:arginyl-tRNA synthetase
VRAEKHLRELLKAYVDDRGYPMPEKLTVEPPKDEKFGDVAANLAMMLAKPAKKNPREIAGDVAEFLEATGEFEKVEVAGPGFLNVFYRPAFWQEVVADVLQSDAGFGAGTMAAPKKVQVEFVSANPTGPLHIGHGRGAAVGDSLARILRFAGCHVETEYYVNDAGRQMFILGNSVLVRLQQIKGRDVPEPEDFYKGDYIKDIAREVLNEHGEEILSMPEDEAREICRARAMADILDGIKEDLEAFGVEHKVWFSEKSLLDEGAVDASFDLLKDKGLAFEDGGAFWFRTSELGDDKDRVLRKSDGLLTYFASDIAYHANKYNRGFDLVIDVWGADHHGYIPRMKAAVQALGRDKDELSIVLVQLVNLLKGGEQIAMSTRAGKFETLADVVAETGADAARFMFLSRKSDSKLDFDLELVKQKSMDNPVYYVQYAHARICSVFRKAEEKGVALPSPDDVSPELTALLDTPEDMKLLKRMERFPDACLAAAENFGPHVVSYYLTDLAGDLHRYYTVNRLLDVEDEKLVQARLALMTAVRQVLKNGLALLGVSAPESM